MNLSLVAAFAAAVLLCVAAQATPGNVPPIVDARDFGKADTWRGFLADAAPPRLEAELQGWSRTAPGGLEADPAVPYEARPSGHLVSLEQGYLAFRQVDIRRHWDCVELAVHNRTPGDGELQFRVYYGISRPGESWPTGGGGRHGFFYRRIPLDFAGWKRLRLVRSDFSEYGGPIGWVDGQLFGAGFAVTRAPSLLTDVHVAGIRLRTSAIQVSAEHDLLRSRGAPLVYRLVVRADGTAPRAVSLRLRAERSPYALSSRPFTASLSAARVTVGSKHPAALTLTATPARGASPGDATTFIVTATDPGDPTARASVRLHAAVERPRPTILRSDDAPDVTPKRESAFEARPVLFDAPAVVQWLERGARAYRAGNLTAGRAVAETLRLLGDPKRGYHALCTQPFEPESGDLRGVTMRDMKTWYQGFWWNTVPAATAYDLLYDSGLLSEADKRAVEDNFLRPLGRISGLYLNACANGQESRIKSVLAMGLVTQDPDLIHRAIDGPLGFAHQIGHDMLDGFTMEGTIDYMGATWRGVAESASMASCSGIDLFHKPCPIDTDRYHVYEADLERPSLNSIWAIDTTPRGTTRTFMDCLWGMTALTYPNGRLPCLADTPDAHLVPMPDAYFTCPETRDEMTRLYGATGAASVTLDQAKAATATLKRRSCNLSSAGLAVLRTGDGNTPQDQYLLLKYGAHGGFHGHLDKLALVYWRHGMELAPDPPICDLENPAWAGYFQSTAAHNTIVIDRRSQQPSTGEKRLTFAALPGFQVVELEGTSAYAAQHARVRRLAMMTRDYVLLVDRVVSTLPHTVDLLVHGTGVDSALTTSVPLAPARGALGESDGYRFAQRVGEGRADGPFEAQWTARDRVGLRAMSLGSEPSTVLAARGFEGFRRGGTPLRSRITYGRYFAGDPLPPDALLVVRREAAPGVTRFVTLLEGHRGTSEIVSAVAVGDTVRVTLRGGAVETIRWRGGEHAGQATTCEFVREEAGKLAEAALVRGERLDGAAGPVLLVKGAPVGCAVAYRNGEAHVRLTDTCTVTLWPPAPVNRTLINGTVARAKQAGESLEIAASVPVDDGSVPRPERGSAAATAAQPAPPPAPAAKRPLPSGAVRWLARDGFNGALAWSPDGRTIAAGGHDGTLRLWDADTGTEKRSEKHAAGILCIAFSPDCKLLAYGDERAIAHVCEAATGRELHALAAPPAASILSLAFSPDGRTLVAGPRGYKGGTGDERSPLIVWDVSTGREVRRMYGHWQMAFSVALSPDGKSAVSSGYDDNSLRMWDPASGKETGRLAGHTLNVPCVAFSPDGKVVASCSEDRTIRLWDPTAGKPVRVLAEQRREVYGIAFSPDGKLLASASQDQSVRLWEVATGKEVAVLEGQGGPVWSVAFSPNGTQLASGAMDGSVLVWRVPR